MVASRIAYPNISIVKTDKQKYSNLIRHGNSEFTSGKLIITACEKISFLCNITFLIDQSEIGGYLPIVILPLGHSHKLQAVSNVEIPFYVLEI